MKSKYDIDSLIETFEIHSRKSEDRKKELIKKYKENCDDPLPEHFKDDFQITRALKSMCEEIQKLKSK
jgi:hypothetical protein